MHLAVKFNLLKDTRHYIYKPESCLENDNYKLYFDRRVLTDIHIQHNRPDIIILNKQQKQAYLLDIAVPNSHNITQTYNTKLFDFLDFSSMVFFLPHLVYCWLPHSLGCYFCGKIRNKNNEKSNVYGSYVVFYCLFCLIRF
jgi:hypothetical protein